MAPGGWKQCNAMCQPVKLLPELAVGDGGEDGLCGFRVEVAGEDDGRVATVVAFVGLGVVCEELDDVLALLVPEGGEEGAVARLQVRRRHAQPNSLGVGPGLQGRCEHHLQSKIVLVSHLISSAQSKDDD